MAKKTMLLLEVGVFLVALSGLAAAEAPVMPFSSDTSVLVQSQADPESGLSSSGSWQAREPVETGAMPSKPGDSPDSCCANSGGPTLDEHGSTVIRQGIDDGP